MRSAAPTLGGRHYDLTLVHGPPFVDMGVDDGALLPPVQWSGYIVDMIEIVAARADFTYTLHGPSGVHAKCTSTDPLQAAGDYGCGQQDALVLNRTDAYWSMYYVTGPRLDAGDFTAPFLSNVGISLAVPMKSQKTGVWSRSEDLLKPFSYPMWLCTLATCVLVSLIVWFSEHSTVVSADSQGLDMQIMQCTEPEAADNPRLQELLETLRQRPEGSVGALSRGALERFYPDALERTLTGGGFETVTWSGRVFNYIWW